jgi:hypothetical protein
MSKKQVIFVLPRSDDPQRAWATVDGNIAFAGYLFDSLMREVRRWADATGAEVFVDPRLRS